MSKLDFWTMIERQNQDEARQRAYEYDKFIKPILKDVFFNDDDKNNIKNREETLK